MARNFYLPPSAQINWDNPAFLAASAQINWDNPAFLAIDTEGYFSGDKSARA
jgi:hypothetical protein